MLLSASSFYDSCLQASLTVCHVTGVTTPINCSVYLSPVTVSWWEAELLPRPFKATGDQRLPAPQVTLD